MGGHRREVTRRRKRLLGSVLLVPDALQHAAHRLGDLDGFAGAVYFHAWRLVARVDGPGLLGELLERAYRERGQQPGEHRRRADGEGTDQQHPAVQVVGLGYGGVIRRAHRHRRRLGPGDLHRAHAVAHPADVGVGVVVLQFGQRDVGIRLDHVATADRDEGVLVVR